ncbi:hypothetical protein GCM10007036_02200 [Alsobacter metallidurans]|uniref:Phosphoenolpyruvate--protein phosphotransferase n=1 Tax=Alsobacter metallidurans TaxID=340221 RepID=A0A917I2J4_9HYPH|nr:aldolase/citrate lyase family protein [Alsobacter metallidurans]GGH07353.1 hypothetical protein GCM10007036_02200 [Alsobacter metallidurans]
MSDGGGETVWRGQVAAPGFGRGPLFSVGGEIGDGEDNPSRVRPAVLDAPHGAVIVGVDLTPAECAALSDRNPAGLALVRGSATSHVAVMAQERGWPLVIRLAGESEIDVGALAGEALLDAVDGRLVRGPSAATTTAFTHRARLWREQRARDAALLPLPAITADRRRVRVGLVIDQLSQLRATDPAHADGIGLVRTEMLFADRAALPGEEGQFATYRILLQWAGDRPVAIRLFDPGEGKTLPGVDAGALRGVAFGLANPAILGVQLRALLRAAAAGDLTIVLPMVESPADVAAMRSALADATEALRRAGRPFGRPRLGAMIETAGALEHVAGLSVERLSVGLGDLAAALGEPRQTGSATPSRALCAAVERVVAHGAALGVDVALCGALAADPALADTWLRLGVRDLSAPPAALAAMKAAIAAIGAGAEADA